MKKLFALLLLAPFFFACSSDDDEPVVSLIKLENIEGKVFVGSEHQLKVAHSPSDLTAPVYEWESSDVEVAKVDDKGKLKAIKEGEATIKVFAPSLNLSSSITISVLPVKATSIKLDKTTNEVVAGESFTLTCKIEPENTTHKSIVWESSNEKIATVSNFGTVTTISDGDVVITAKLGSLKDECKVKVTPVRVSGINLNVNTASIEVLEDFQLEAIVAPTNAKNKNVVWKSSNEDIASVDNTGKVTTKAVGNAVITVTTEDGNYSASANVSVYDFTDKIEVSLSRSMVTTPWESYTAINGKLQNNSKKTIVAKKVTIYENGAILSYQDINNTLIPGADVSYSIKRDGNFRFVYEYEYNGVKYTTK